MSILKEECGVFGIWDPDGYCANTTCSALVALQHRGQEGCGIAVNKDREISYYKDTGLVNEVFNSEILEKYPGNMAVGHVRYSTAGGSLRENVQPLVLRYIKGTIAIAHNGNITNTEELRTGLEYNGAIFQTTADSEIIAYQIARERIRSRSIEEAVKRTMHRLKGAFSILVMSPQKLIAARDPWGFRPLSLGKLDNGAIVFASETTAFDAIGAKFVRDIEPGEVVTVFKGQIESEQIIEPGETNLCIFEHIYFARPDSIVDGQPVHEARKMAGRFLAMQSPVEADIVIGVPDSGLSAAQGYADESGIPLRMGFNKNKYIARTFISPEQQLRQNAVKMKLNALKSEVSGKKVIMIDDSIVRGTTSAHIVSLLREAGAKEVHVRISSPPFKWPCFFGTDVPTRKELIANHYDVEDTAKYIGTDSLDYLSLENLLKIAPDSTRGFCTACFTGKYPVDVSHLLAKLEGKKK
ncbi:MAG: amidophosphoribosyltransferase [Clostridiales bacterium]|nr:amidophosphoribosyltransferase [Clostridiales bacterium]